VSHRRATPLTDTVGGVARGGYTRAEGGRTSAVRMGVWARVLVVGVLVVGFGIDAGVAGAAGGVLVVGAPGAAPMVAAAGQVVSFTAPVSVLLDGAPDQNTPYIYSWSFGATGPDASHVFTVVGDVTVTVTVIDSTGYQGQSSVTVQIIPPGSAAQTTTTPPPAPSTTTPTTTPTKPPTKKKKKPKPTASRSPGSGGNGSGSGSGNGRGSGTGSGASVGTTSPVLAPSQSTTTQAVPSVPAVAPPKAPSKVRRNAPVVGFLISQPPAKAKGGGTGPRAAPVKNRPVVSAGSMSALGWALTVVLAVGLMVRGGWTAFEPRARYRRLAAT
jgi:hypothetical protein